MNVCNECRKSSMLIGVNLGICLVVVEIREKAIAEAINGVEHFVIEQWDTGRVFRSEFVYRLMGRIP